MQYYWCSIILFSFLSFPEFHRVVPLLQMCCTIEFVYDHVYFCVYVYLSSYLPCMRENMHLLCFWSWLTSLSMVSSNCIHYLQTPCHYSLWLILHCVYIPQFHDPFISCRAFGLFPELGCCE
jgi:hypothetical protein